MRAVVLPDPHHLRRLPESGSLALLLASLDVADSALRLEHPCLDFDAPDDQHLPPSTELLAELLLARFTELQTLIARYNAAAADAAGILNQTDLPF